jgi:hypothetical protein
MERCARQALRAVAAGSRRVDWRRAAAATGRVSGAFPSLLRPILAEIYLCHAGSGHQTEDENVWTQAPEACKARWAVLSREG